MKYPRLTLALITSLTLAALAFTSLTFAQDAPKKAKDDAKQKAKAKPAAKAKAVPPPEPPYPPSLPDGKEFVTDTSPDFLTPPTTLRLDVKIAKTPPTVDFAYFPGQSYRGNPWSNWGDSMFANGKYYASIGDHLAPGGTAFLWEFDPATRKFRQLVDVKKLLGLPEGRYTPGKIHTQLTLANDGWIYFGTHRGGTKATFGDKDYKGDWIIRVDPKTAKAEIISEGPVPGHCIPTGFTDPQRMIFYGGTEPEAREGETSITFFAYDLRAKKLIYRGFEGPARAMIFAKSTGKVYWLEDKLDDAPLVRFDPAKPGKPERIPGAIGLRAASEETPQGIVYTVSHARGKESGSEFYAFNTKTEKIESLGAAAVGGQQYITSLDCDPTGRFFYYVPGAHGGAEQDGSPIVQFDTKTKQKKVIAFLHPFYEKKYAVTPRGTYSVALDQKGETLYITWNCSRGTRVWDSCALTVVHIPASER